MKKFFLIPLLACSFCAMAWGSEVVVNNFADLKDALSSTGTADVVKLGQDITYTANGSTDYLLNIERSLTLDGQGHKIIGWGKCNANHDEGKTYYILTPLAINFGEAASNLDVTVKNISMSTLANTKGSSHEIGLMVFDKVSKLTVEACDIRSHNKGYNNSGIAVYGETSTALVLKIKDSFINAGESGYGMAVLKPIDADFQNTTFVGYSCMTLYAPTALMEKNYRTQTAFGNLTSGTRGTTIQATNCQFDAPNMHSGEANAYATFALEDDGIGITLINCGIDATNYGDQKQWGIMASPRTPTSRRTQDINVTFKGDNTHINGNLLGIMLSEFQAMRKDYKEAAYGTSPTWFYAYEDGYDYFKHIVIPGESYTVTANFNMTIEGGTYDFDPSAYTYAGRIDTEAEGYAAYLAGREASSMEPPFVQHHINIPATHEVQTIHQQGVAIPLYRVTKKHTTTETLNSNSGSNPQTAFAVTENTTLDQPTTTAGYVGVSNNAELSVGGASNQVLEVNNGLDVQGDAKVVVKAGSTLFIGEGGLISEKPENIVVEASNDAAVTFLMSPEIKVNTTPDATFKFKSVAKQNGDGTCVWQRFGIPSFDGKTTMSWEEAVQTALYRVNYETGDWELVKPIGFGPFEITDGISFQCYNMTIDGTEPIEYTFKGKLMGNTNATLEFDHGWNFYANSYTAPIDIKAFVLEIVSKFGGNVSGTIYLNRYGTDVWDPFNFSDFILGRASTTEILPMQAFVLILREGDDAVGAINYKDNVYTPIWNKLHPKSPMPAKQPAYEQAAYNGVVISASDGVNADELAVLEGEGLSDDFDNGFDADKYDNGLSFSIYCTIGADKMSTYATNDLTDKYVAFDTNKAGEFTLSFQNALGDDIVLYDEVAKKSVTMKDGNTYTFTAEAGNYPQRFRLNPSDVPSAIEETDASIQKITKYLDKEGQIYIRRAGNVYTVQGQTVK